MKNEGKATDRNQNPPNPLPQQIKEEGFNGVLPEFGFRPDLVGGPELHPVDLGMFICLRRETSPHHLILMELK